MKLLIIFVLSIFVAANSLQAQNRSKYNIIRCVDKDSSYRNYYSEFHFINPAPKFSVSGDTVFFDAEEIYYCVPPNVRFEYYMKGRTLTMIQHFIVPDKITECQSDFHITGWVIIKQGLKDLILLDWIRQYINSSGKIIQDSKKIFEIQTTTSFVEFR